MRGVWGWQWHQLDHMQTICTSLQTDNHTSASSLIFTGRMLHLTPNQQCQCTEHIPQKDHIKSTPLPDSNRLVKHA